MKSNTFVGKHRKHLSEIVGGGSFVDEDVVFGVGSEGGFEDFL